MLNGRVNEEIATKREGRAAGRQKPSIAVETTALGQSEEYGAVQHATRRTCLGKAGNVHVANIADSPKAVLDVDVGLSGQQSRAVRRGCFLTCSNSRCRIIAQLHNISKDNVVYRRSSTEEHHHIQIGSTASARYRDEPRPAACFAVV